MFKRFPRFSNCNLVSLGDINQLISTTSFSGVNTCKMLPLYIFNSELDLNSSNDFTSSSCNDDDASVSANIASDNELCSRSLFKRVQAIINPGFSRGTGGSASAIPELRDYYSLSLIFPRALIFEGLLLGIPEISPSLIFVPVRNVSIIAVSSFFSSPV